MASLLALMYVKVVVFTENMIDGIKTNVASRYQFGGV